MQKGLAIAHCPQKRVESCIVSGQSKEILAALERLGIQTLCPSPCPNLAEPLREHADMLCFPAEKGRIFLEPGQKQLFEGLKLRGMVPRYIEKSLAAKYPADAALNGALVGKHFFANPASLSAAILESVLQEGHRLTAVKQGYTKCSLAVVDEGAVITEDAGIARAALAQGIAVLKLEPGQVKLKGYPYGFIGGCCGKIGPWELAFAGSLSAHPQGKEIERFCRDRGVIPLELINGRLQDIGGILPILEEK